MYACVYVTVIKHVTHVYVLYMSMFICMHLIRIYMIMDDFVYIVYIYCIYVFIFMCVSVYHDERIFKILFFSVWVLGLGWSKIKAKSKLDMVRQLEIPGSREYHISTGIKIDMENLLLLVKDIESFSVCDKIVWLVISLINLVTIDI